MKQASIFHRLEYSYEQEVLLSPQVLYLHPRQDSFCELEHLDLEIYPKPTNLSTHHDAEGNTQQVAVFDAPTNVLIVELKAKMKLQSFNPFDFFFVPKETSKLPFRYTTEQETVLSPYFAKEMLPSEVVLLSNELVYKSEQFTAAFLMAAIEFISNNISYEIRETGRANPSELTLLSKKGSCRDFSILFSDLCRAQGLATRFVSGYYVGQDSEYQDQSHHLHAWVEVYLPGGGWRGYDPTQNEVVCGNHIALATSFDLQNIPPLSGFYTGNSASILKTIVDLKMC